MAADNKLPTWVLIEIYAPSHLHSAQSEISEVQSWLRSDSSPIAPMTDAQAGARTEVLRIAGEVERLIDQAKGLLQREDRNG